MNEIDVKIIKMIVMATYSSHQCYVMKKRDLFPMNEMGIKISKNVSHGHPSPSKNKINTVL